MDTLSKLSILADSAKYDAACTSSGADRAPRKGMLGMAAYACNPATWQVRAGGTLVQGQASLHSEFEASLIYIENSRPTRTV